MATNKQTKLSTADKMRLQADYVGKAIVTASDLPKSSARKGSVTLEISTALSSILKDNATFAKAAEDFTRKSADLSEVRAKLAKSPVSLQIVRTIAQCHADKMPKTWVTANLEVLLRAAESLSKGTAKVYRTNTKAVMALYGTKALDAKLVPTGKAKALPGLKNIYDSIKEDDKSGDTPKTDTAKPVDNLKVILSSLRAALSDSPACVVYFEQFIADEIKAGSVIGKAVDQP